MTDLTWTLGDRLRKARELAGLTQKALLAQVGISKNQASRYELGHATPRLIVIRRWAEVTGAPLDWLTNGEQADRPVELRAQQETPTTNGGGTSKRHGTLPEDEISKYEISANERHEAA